MAHYVIGTAGHIDHGKTSLSQALTGIHTDRLKEEKERNISIELGFAPFTLPNGQKVSLIDVPGHERFIRHMVSGVAGVDLILLVVAADESVMPQTLEHLHILHLLGVKKGIIVVNKVDLVEDDFLSLVEEEIRETVKDTFLAEAPMAFVSAKTGKGVDELKQQIQTELESIPARSQEGAFRMPIDRVFTLKGIGTVVTGTAYNGTVRVGDELELMPSEEKVKVRGLQVHGESVSEAYAGQRVAINLTQINLEDIERGQLLVTPKYWNTTTRLDVELQTLPDLDFPIKHRSELRLHMGTKEVLCDIILFDRKELQPGDTATVQLILDEQMIASREERFILRRPSPVTTIGGGFIIDPYGKKQKIRPETADLLKAKAEGTLSERMVRLLNEPSRDLVTISEIAETLTVPYETIMEEIVPLIEQKELLTVPKITDINSKDNRLHENTFVQSVQKFTSLREKLHHILSEAHQQYPLKTGLSIAEIHQKLMPKLAFKTFHPWVAQYREELEIKESTGSVALADFKPTLPTHLQRKVDQIQTELQKDPFNPVKWEALMAQNLIEKKWQNDLLHFLAECRFWYKVSDEEILYHIGVDEGRKKILHYFESHDEMSIQDARDLLDLSRKKLVPLLDLMDTLGITERKDNVRTLKAT
jgi:selenocysteine-specific elongation factor